MNDSLCEKLVSKLNSDRELLSFLIDSIEDDTYIALARNDKSFRRKVFKGYSTKRENLKYVRPRIHSWIDEHKSAIKMLVQIWEMENTDVIKFFQILKPDYLSNHKDYFVDKLGGHFIELVKECIGCDIFADLSDAESTDDENDSEDLNPISPFLAALERMIEPYGKSPDEESTNIPDESGGSARGDGSKKLRRLSAKLEDREKEIRNLNIRIQELERAKDELASRCESLAKKNDELKANMEQAVICKINEFKRSLALEFEDEKIRQSFDESVEGNAKMIEMAREAIQSQIKDNRRYGTVRMLREQTEEMKRLIDEIEELKHQSVRVIPALDEIHRELKNRLEALISDPQISNALKIFISEDIKLERDAIAKLPVSKSSLPVLEKMEEMAADLRNAQLINEESFNTVQMMIREKTKVITTYYSLGGDKIRRPDEGTFDDFLKKGCTRGKVLLIDGNNVLLTKLFYNGRIEGYDSFRAARLDFNRSVEKKADLFKHIYIVYDGFENREEVKKRCTIIFTKKDDMQADDKIVNLASSMNRSDIILATNDTELIERSGVDLVLDSRECFDFFVTDASLPLV